MSYPPSEEDVLQGFIAWLLSTGRGRFEVESRPDRQERNARTFDFVCIDRASGSRIAVELTSAWRREQGGREDAEWARWTRRFGELVNPHVDAEYHASVAIGFSRDVSPETAAQVVLQAVASTNWGVLRGRSVELSVPPTSMRLSCAGTRRRVVEFARIAPEDPRPDFARFIAGVIESKNDQLRVAKQQGLPTYLVVYNTCWPLFDDQSLQVVADSIRPEICENVDQLVVVHGNCPDDCWCIPINLPHDAWVRVKKRSK